MFLLLSVVIGCRDDWDGGGAFFLFPAEVEGMDGSAGKAGKGGDLMLLSAWVTGGVNGGGYGLGGDFRDGSRGMVFSFGNGGRSGKSVFENIGVGEYTLVASNLKTAFTVGFGGGAGD